MTSSARVNLAAVHYHFGSKGELLRATLERRIGPANAERLRLLDALEAADEPPSVEQILDALLRPVVLGGPADAPQVLSLLHSEEEAIVRPLLRRLFGAVEERFVAALARELPGLDRATVVTRVQLLIGSMIHVLSGRFRWSPCFEKLGEPPSDEAVLAHMVAFLAPGLRSPAPRPGTAARAGRREDAA